jgi:hypothetical protein
MNLSGSVQAHRVSRIPGGDFNECQGENKCEWEQRRDREIECAVSADRL